MDQAQRHGTFFASRCRRVIRSPGRCIGPGGQGACDKGIPPAGIRLCAAGRERRWSVRAPGARNDRQTERRPAAHRARRQDDRYSARGEKTVRRYKKNLTARAQRSVRLAGRCDEPQHMVDRVVGLDEVGCVFGGARCDIGSAVRACDGVRVNKLMAPPAELQDGRHVRLPSVGTDRLRRRWFVHDLGAAVAVDRFHHQLKSTKVERPARRVFDLHDSLAKPSPRQLERAVVGVSLLAELTASSVARILRQAAYSCFTRSFVGRAPAVRPVRTAADRVGRRQVLVRRCKRFAVDTSARPRYLRF